MEKEFIPYDLALELKELGFDEECLAYYTPPESGNLYRLNDKETNLCLLSTKLSGELHGHGSVKNGLFKYLKDNDRTSGELYLLSIATAAPLWQQVFDWFLNRGYFADIKPDLIVTSFWSYRVVDINGKYNPENLHCYRFTYYRDARLECLKKLIEIAKEKNVK